MKYLFIGLGAFCLMVIVLPFALGFLPAVASPIEDLRTQPATNTGLACTSANVGTPTATSGQCTITLTTASAHGTLDDTTVQQTAPTSVDRTATSTLNINNRTQITVSSLSSTPTAYTFTVTYEDRPSDVSQLADQLLRNGTLLILLAILGSLAAGILAIFGIRMMRNRS